MRYETITPKAAFWIIGSALLVVAIGLANYFVANELAYSIFYLLPILLATRHAGRQAGILMSCLSVMDWLYTDIYFVRRVYQLPITPYWNALVSCAFFLIITLVYSRWEQEFKNARMDPITQLPNRKAFLEAAQIAIRLCQRYSHAFSIACLDVDDYKRINDRWDHAAGDKLLYDIAQRLRQHLRATDIIGHLGSDEFIILMPESYAGSAERSLRRILSEFNLPIEPYGRIGFSVGMVTFDRVSLPMDEMLSSADLLMHEAKAAGKDRLLHKNIQSVNPEAKSPTNAPQ